MKTSDSDKDRYHQMSRSERVSQARRHAMDAIMRRSEHQEERQSTRNDRSSYWTNIDDRDREREQRHLLPTKSSRRSAQEAEIEIERLCQQLELKEIELREAKHEIKCLTERESEKSRPKSRAFETRERELLQDLESVRRSLESDRAKSDERCRTAVGECERLLRFVLAIEKHTLYGRHAVGSQTVVGLLLKTRQGLESLRGVLGLGINNSSHPFQEDDNILDVVGTSGVRESLTQSLGTANRTNTLESALLKSAREQGVETALLEMCRSLEAENAKLEETVHTLRKDLDDYAREADIGKLIPHYRLAIVRARSQIIFLQKQIEREQATSDSLRKELEESYKCLQDLLDEKESESPFKNKLKGPAKELAPAHKSSDMERRRADHDEKERRRGERRSGGSGEGEEKYREDRHKHRDKDSRRHRHAADLDESDLYSDRYSIQSTVASTRGSDRESRRNSSSYRREKKELSDREYDREHRKRTKDTKERRNVHPNIAPHNNPRRSGGANADAAALDGEFPVTDARTATAMFSRSILGQYGPVAPSQVQHVEEELTELDREIGALKGLLEEAALKHTQRIVADAIDSSGVMAAL